MCRTQYVLALVALYVGLAHPWDIAVSLGDNLEFYTNGSKTGTVRFKSQNLAALAYDEVHNMILYVDKQSDNDAICGYYLHSMEHQCFIKTVSRNIQSIAFDPATDKLFFTDSNERSINWISLKPGSVNNVNGNLFIKTDNLIPSDIGVDSCRGYIYWSYLKDGSKYMERARFNGSDREVLITWLPIFSFCMDPQTQNIYYFDGCNTCILEFLKRGDWNGKNDIHYFTHTHLSESKELAVSKELTVSKDYIYWIQSSQNYSIVWHLPKNHMEGDEPKVISKFYNKSPLDIVANYKIKDQIQGREDCEVLSSLSTKITVTNNCFNIQRTTDTEQTTEHATVAEIFCVHGKKVSETSVCKCTPGYIGERCDVSVCENYCLQGDCSFNDEGLPKCRCNAGYSGERCEVYACHGYCLNNGICSLDEEDEPFCKCIGNHEGTRCEAAINDTFTNTPMFDSAKRNITLAELLSNWRKPSSKMYLTVEV